MSKSIYAVYGASGFGREVMPLVRETFSNELAAEFVFIDDGATDEFVNGVKVCTFDAFLKLEADAKYATLAIANSKTREVLFEKLEKNRINHLSIIAKNAVVLDEVDTGKNLILAPFTTLTSNVQIGKAFHANIYSYVAHDCVIGDFVTFGPGVKCNGNVHIQSHAYIGTGAIIKQGKPNKPLVIGEGAIVAAGAVVTKNIPAGITVFGNPAVPLTKENMRKMR
ncbi:MAG: acetyltransferase [Piscirickettsiaceae bacterium CG_4_10_14_3_um_filter_44_349]|uniref:acetyltransferase n=1 Tax=Shewanella TaxID=22 RepID=UPI000C5F84A6|nr:MULTISPECIES: acetyltransferase [Shewanella]NCQ40235.1 acetyltransferase [Shewanella vesiculosa]PIP99121.1 MAG: acetyltransferase [Shewanella sp. CG18_big_fil_WC_8_21_14_2_50_42_11]PIX78348.1 MAG: acetyltransferase [Piscirickettsiaceae bacterium CG_4_10_14_3_um_filter_44_349]